MMAGPEQPVYFPVPWAPDATISFLYSPAAMRALIPAEGFRELAWLDVSKRTLAWLQERAAASEFTPPRGPTGERAISLALPCAI